MTDSANGPRNSETVLDENPYKVLKVNSGPFIARAAHVGTLASSGIELRTLSPKDTRKVIVRQGDALYSAMLVADPFLAEWPEFKDRALYPVWKICLDHQNHVVSFEAMPLNDEEVQQQAAQRVTDRLHSVGRQMHIGWGTVDSIARDHQMTGADDWEAKAAQGIVDYAMAESSRTAMSKVALNKAQWDYWWREDKNDYPWESKTVTEATEVKVNADGIPDVPGPNKHSTYEPKRMVHAIPAYIMRELNLPKDTTSEVLGSLVKECFGGEALNQQMIEHKSPEWIWLCVENFVQRKNAKGEKEPVTAQSEKVAEKAPETAPAYTSTPTVTPPTPAGKSEPQPTPVSSALPEAPFSANFHMFNRLGVNVQFTIRSATVNDGVKRVDLTIAVLLENGYTVDRPGIAAPSGSAAPAPQNADKGTSPCVLIKCVKSYQAGKPQLEFEVDGFEKPFRFTQEKWEQLTKVLKAHTNGREFTAADMAEGKKYAGNWVLDWEKKTKDDKTFWNVLALRDAA